MLGLANTPMRWETKRLEFRGLRSLANWLQYSVGVARLSRLAARSMCQVM